MRPTQAIRRRYSPIVLAAMSAAVLAVPTPVSGEVGADSVAILVAGDPAPGSPTDGDGLVLNETNVFLVTGIAVHPWTGEVYYAEADKHRIRRIDRSGRVHTVVGTGEPGVGGENVPGLAALVNSPHGLDFDGDGNLYFVDLANRRVRILDTLGFVSTLPGPGNTVDPDFLRTETPADIAVNEAGTRVFIADGGAHRVWEWSQQTYREFAGTGDRGYRGDGGPAASASLDTPTGVDLSDDEQTLLIVDADNHVIRTVDASGRITTAVGNGRAGVPTAGALTNTRVRGLLTATFDENDDIYWLDFDGENVWRTQNGRIAPVTNTGSTNPVLGTLEGDRPTVLAFDERGAFGAPGSLLIGFDGSIVIGFDDGPTAVPERQNPYGRPAEDEVARLYQATFRRRPDPGGHRFWVDRYQAPGGSLENIAIEFLASAEASLIYDGSTDGEFVDRLYLNVLGREGDPEGRAFWVQTLADGAARHEILIQFSNSPENVNGTRTAPAMDGRTMAVLRLYEAAFERRPDAGGLAFWVEQSANGLSLDAMATQFLASPEAASLAASSDLDFVQQLYLNVFDRSADLGGRDYWFGLLDRGELSKGQVLAALSESLENLRGTGTA